MVEFQSHKPISAIANQALLCLSAGQKFSIHEIAKIIEQPLGKIWDAIRELEDQKLIGQQNGKFQLTEKGFEHLAQKGIRPKKPIGDISPNYFKKLKPPLFGTWKDMGIWLIVPILFILILLYISSLITHGFNSLYWKLFSYGISLILYVILLSTYIKRSYHTVIENERLVVFRLGKCEGAKGPGPVLVIPFIDNPKVVDLRVKPKEVPHETCITQDNVQIDVDFVFYWQIEDPVLSLTKVTNPEESITLLATALLRAVIAHFPFNDVLNQRESINDLLKAKIDEISSEWGLYVSTMEIREIKPPEEIVKSMHNQRAAEWQRQATVTTAEGQVEALRLLFAVASQLDTNTLNLKYFETLQKLGEGQSTKYVLPIELSNLIQSWINKNHNDESTQHRNNTINIVPDSKDPT